MASTEGTYYARRAEQERVLSEEAPSEMVARIHRDLAQHYLQLAANPTKRPLGWVMEDLSR